MLLLSQLGLGIALLMSNSVTAIFATLAGAAIYIMLSAAAYRVGVLQIAGVIGTGLLFLVGPATIKTALFAAAGRDESMSGRDDLWMQVFNQGLKTPFFGSGYGSFWYEGRGREITGTWNPRQSHNAYIDVFVDLGLIGVILVLFTVHAKMLTGWYRVAGRRGTAQRRAVASIVAMGCALCFVGAFGESFLLKMEKYQFFIFSWSLMLLENRDSNGIASEFS